MNPTITLSAEEARELYTTGSLVKTVENEWQFGVECFDSMLSQTAKGTWLVSYFVETHKPRIGKVRHEKTLSPPFQEGVVYDVSINRFARFRATPTTQKPEVVDGTVVWKCALESVKK